MRCEVNARQGYHHGDLRNALLDAADKLLQAEGLQGFTLRACARLAGVSHAAPKHHFGDVRGLLGAAQAAQSRTTLPDWPDRIVSKPFWNSETGRRWVMIGSRLSPD